MMETWRDYLRGAEVGLVNVLDMRCNDAEAELGRYQALRRTISEKARKRMATAHKRAAKEAGHG